MPRLLKKAQENHITVDWTKIMSLQRESVRDELKGRLDRGNSRQMQEYAPRLIALAMLRFIIEEGDMMS